ncbi:MAG: ROK family protein [Clostridia bacterium]|nr:ROK family protein [Clostridia bacterium]
MRVLCLDIGGTYIKFGTLDESGALVSDGRRPTNAINREGILESVAGVLSHAAGFDAVALSCAGVIDSDNGVVLRASGALPLGDGFALKAYVEALTGVPAHVENDVNCAALGELWLGAARGARNCAVIAFGTSIGGALILGGELYRGSRFGAGEIGHVTLHPGGELCCCGRRGCFSAYAAASALLERAGDLFERGFSALAAEDSRAGRAVRDWAREAALGIACIVHTFDPERVVLGGAIMELEGAVDIIRPELKRALLPSHGDVELCAAALGNRAALYGAARALFRARMD